MKDLDEFLYKLKNNEQAIPHSFTNTIRSFSPKSKESRNWIMKVNKIRKSIIIAMSLLLGSGVVFAVTGGKIEGIPALDWLGLKFSDKYLEYKQPVENQVVAFGNTSVELTSTLCNEGITILEFDIKLSQEDYKNLKIGESILTEEFLELTENAKSIAKDNIIIELKNKKYNEEIQKGNSKIRLEDIIVPEEEINLKYEERIKELDNAVEERKNTFFSVALALNVNQKGGTYNYDVLNPDMDWYASLYIDDIPYNVRNMEKVEKVSDYEYRVYNMFLLSDDIINGKENFKITLKNNKLVNIVDWKAMQNTWFGHGNSLISDYEMMKTPHVSIIDLPGEFEVNVSKNNILKDSKIIENPKIKSEFRNITQTVEKVVVSPIQTIVTINHSATQQSSNAFANKYNNPNIEHLPITEQYKVYDANGKELSCFSMSNKNTLIYSDGTREDYDYHDLPNKKYSNATWENINYLLIENTDTDYIKIVPVETLHNPVNGEENTGTDIHYEMNPLIINLK